jgi:TonB family protein
MKTLFYFFVLLPVVCAAQNNIEPLFYDWQWKPCTPALARFMAMMQKTESGWLRSDYYLSNNGLQMNGLYADSACKIRNGDFTYFYYSGIPSSVGKYSNNKKNGLWLSYHPNGMMSDSINYINGKAVGTALKWHSNGYQADSSVYAGGGAVTSIGWFSNGNISYAGRYINDTMMEGRWQFFNINGGLAAKITYNNGKITAGEYYDEAGSIITEPQFKNSDASFKGGITNWRKYLENKLQFPNGYKLVNTDIITVVVEFLVDEEGNVQDAYVDVPFKKPFDEEALRIIKKSPKWLPEIRHNRRVSTYLRQPISFTQIEQ